MKEFIERYNIDIDDKYFQLLLTWVIKVTSTAEKFTMDLFKVFSKLSKCNQKVRVKCKRISKQCRKMEVIHGLVIKNLIPDYFVTALRWSANPVHCHFREAVGRKPAPLQPTWRGRIFCPPPFRMRRYNQRSWYFR